MPTKLMLKIKAFFDKAQYDPKDESVKLLREVYNNSIVLKDKDE